MDWVESVLFRVRAELVEAQRVLDQVEERWELIAEAKRVALQHRDDLERLEENLKKLMNPTRPDTDL